MFVGFIAVVVILLVIVGLMSSGATNGSGGVDQTKATKALSEVSALVQSTGFYKTTTSDSNYAGLTVDTLASNGIVASIDLVPSTVDFIGNGGAMTAGVNVVKSKAVDGLYYNITVGDTSAAMKIDIVADSTKISSTLQSGLAKALESSYAKLSPSAVDVGVIGTTTDNVVNTIANDGAASVQFN